jgi:hypothetical protein
MAFFFISLSFNPPFDKNNDNWCLDFRLSEVITINDDDNPVKIPLLYIDNDSNFIFTDLLAHNVKVFDKDGEPLQEFGRYGRGPGDLEYPSASFRKSDSIYTITFTGMLTVWDLHSRQIHQTTQFPVLNTSGFKLLNDSLIIMNGVKVSGSNLQTGKRLHLVNLNNNEIIHSFFSEPDEYLPYRGITSSIQDIISFDTRDNKIVVSYGASPKIYFYRVSSNSVELTDVQDLGVSDSFESVLNHKISDLLDIRTTASKYSTVSRLLFMDDGNLVAQVRRYHPLDQSGNYTGAEYFHFYHDTDSGQTCMLSLDGSLAATDGNSLFVVKESDKTIIYKYKN